LGAKILILWCRFVTSRLRIHSLDSGMPTARLPPITIPQSLFPKQAK
jgi:hypothetical protein